MVTWTLSNAAARSLLCLCLLIIVGTAIASYLTQPFNRVFLGLTFVCGVVVPLCLVVLSRGGRAFPKDLDQAPLQLRRIAAYFMPLLAANLAIAIPYISDALSERVYYVVSEAIYLLTFAAVPALLLASRWWLWPKVGPAGGRRGVIVVAVLGLAFALFLTWGNPDRKVVDVGVARIGLATGLALIGSTSEELIFRVMLLSYLATALRSSFSALVVSSFVFGVIHIPFELDWSNLPPMWDPTLTVRPLFRTAIGVFLGVIWIRTRSLLISGGVHTAINLTPVLAKYSTVWV